MPAAALILACSLVCSVAFASAGPAAHAAATTTPADATRASTSPMRTVGVTDAVRHLQRSGYEFVYSPGLVGHGSTINLAADEELDIATFKRALVAIGLTLERNARNTFFIVALDTPSAPAAKSLTGRVTDAATGEPLRGVVVEIDGAVVYTDDRGMFEIKAAEAHAVLVSRAGYRARQVAAQTTSDILNIPLDPQPRIEEIVVVSSRYALRSAAGASVHSLDADEITGLPALGDDAMRAANHLPGTASIGVSAKPHIRGGSQDELLVLFNDVELLEPFHLRDFHSVFASFNPSLVKSIDVYTGGFPARFGDRMSGVMDIQPALDATDFRAELMLSFLTASASALGTTHEGRGRWALSARRGNLDFVIDRIDRSTGDPKYSDIFASYSYDLDTATQLEFGLIAYDDDVVLKDLDDGDGEFAQSRYDNAYTWLQLHRDWSESTSSSTILSYGGIDHSRNGFINDEDPEEGSSNLNDNRHFDIYALTHRHFMDFSEQLTVELGGRFNYQKGSYDTAAVLQRGGLGLVIGLPPVEVRRVDTNPSGTSGGVYSSARLRPAERLTLELGMRWDYQDYGRGFDKQFSPRASARFELTNSTQLRLSAGRFYQPEQIHELQAADGVGRFQAPQYADHYIVGIDHRFGTSGLTLRSEVFYKNIRDTKRRFENLFNPLVLMPEIASDRIEVAPSKAHAEGLEVTFDYQPTDNLNTWLSYTHASTEDRVNGSWQPRAWDQEDTLSTGFIWNPGAWSVSAAVLWHSGWRTTRLPSFISEGEDLGLQRNSDRLPGYLSIDAKLGYTWQWDQQSLTLFAEVTNLLDRNNVGAYEYDFEEDDVNGGFEVTPERFTLLPLVPSIGIRWAFD